MPSIIHSTILLVCLLAVQHQCTAKEKFDPLMMSYLEELHDDDSDITGADGIESSTTLVDEDVDLIDEDAPHCANDAVAQLKCENGSCHHIGFVCETIEWNGEKQGYCCHNGVDFDPAEPPEPDLSAELDAH